MTAASDASRWAIVASRFHEVVVDRLVAGARACLASRGVAAESVDLIRVPGAFELPQAVAALVRPQGGHRTPAGVIVLGCVVRGETPHFDYVCQVASRGVSEEAARSGTPLGFGLLTCDTMEQALARAGGDKGDKGWEAAEAAWEMASVLDAIRRLRAR